MEVTGTWIPEVKVVKMRKFPDRRGFFSETYNEKAFVEAGIVQKFVQDNHVLSVDKGVVRGLHFQLPPFAQDKLVRVIRGSIFDVALDLRKASPTFGKWVSVVLSSEEWNQVLVPVGFAHGFCTLEPNAEVIYKVTNYYSVPHERGVLWNDPALEIPWPVQEDQAVLSDKDQVLPRLADLTEFF
jgi:dTDP-4-dehydrorhamnose 3,5-epimerase